MFNYFPQIVQQKSLGKQRRQGKLKWPPLAVTASRVRKMKENIRTSKCKGDGKKEMQEELQAQSHPPQM